MKRNLPAPQVQRTMLHGSEQWGLADVNWSGPSGNAVKYFELFDPWPKGQVMCNTLRPRLSEAAGKVVWGDGLLVWCVWCSSEAVKTFEATNGGNGSEAMSYGIS